MTFVRFVSDLVMFLLQSLRTVSFSGAIEHGFTDRCESSGMRVPGPGPKVSKVKDRV